MTFTQQDLNLTDPTKGYAHFVLYNEPGPGAVGAAWNATVAIEEQSAYAREWLGRLQRREPNALHATLVDSQQIPSLFDPCVDDDDASPSAVGGTGCVCRRAWFDPEFGLPVVGEHFRTRRGDTDRWTFRTYAPLDLRPDDVFASVIIDRTSGLFWIRTAAGTLSLLPEYVSRGYGVGRTGSGPAAFAEYLHKLTASNGHDTAAGSPPFGQDVDRQLLAWAASPAANRDQELTLEDLKAIQRN